MDYQLLAERVVRRGTGQTADCYRLRVSDFEALFSIGVYPFEREKRQRVRINVELTLDHPGPGFQDRIDAVLSYETIVQFLRSLAQGEHIGLLETLGERVLGFCFEDRRVRRAAVTVEKPDYFPDAAAVGVTLERERPGNR